MFLSSFLILSLLFTLINYVFAGDCDALAGRAEELAKCCTVKDPFPKNDFMKCYNSAQGTDEERIICAVECNFRENGILNQNNEYVDRIEEDEWRGQVTDIVESCWAKLDAMKQVSAEKSTKCPLLYMMMQMCLSNSMFVGCPTQEWHSSDFCKGAKQSKCLN